MSEEIQHPEPQIYCPKCLETITTINPRILAMATSYRGVIDYLAKRFKPKDQKWLRAGRCPYKCGGYFYQQGKLSVRVPFYLKDRHTQKEAEQNEIERAAEMLEKAIFGGKEGVTIALDED